MTHRVGPKGQVVIPKDLRDESGIQPGDEVSFWLDDDHVAVRPTSLRRPLAYVDAFGAALAVDADAELWTGDLEFLVAEASWRWRDRRARN